ncbi:MAG: hypothetical protein GXY61_05985 [Lentisphaerae bacterium]|nr:hypothetical protein [Lentisphaerota bacterium]
MKIELTEENYRLLLFGANMLEIEPTEFLNDYLLSNMPDMEEPVAGWLRDFYNWIDFPTAKDAKRVAVRLMSWEQKKDGQHFGLPEIHVQGE